MRLGTIEVTQSIECRCGHEVEAGTVRRAYAKLFIHAWRRHGVTTRELAAGLWRLLRGHR